MQWLIFTLLSDGRVSNYCCRIHVQLPGKEYATLYSVYHEIKPPKNAVTRNHCLIGLSSSLEEQSIALHTIHVQESLADAKVSARQQCVYEDPYRRNLQQICN